jgi:hypothetical protein
VALHARVVCPACATLVGESLTHGPVLSRTFFDDAPLTLLRGRPLRQKSFVFLVQQVGECLMPHPWQIRGPRYAAFRFIKSLLDEPRLDVVNRPLKGEIPIVQT